MSPAYGSVTSASSASTMRRLIGGPKRRRSRRASGVTTYNQRSSVTAGRDPASAHLGRSPRHADRQPPRREQNAPRRVGSAPHQAAHRPAPATNPSRRRRSATSKATAASCSDSSSTNRCKRSFLVTGGFYNRACDAERGVLVVLRGSAEITRGSPAKHTKRPHKAHRAVPTRRRSAS